MYLSLVMCMICAPDVWDLVLVPHKGSLVSEGGAKSKYLSKD